MKKPLGTLILLSALLLSNCASTKMVDQQHKNKEIVKLWFEEGWNNNRQRELIPICFDENWEEGNPILADQMMGHKGMYQLVDEFQKAFTEFHFDITHLVAEGNIVSLRYEVSAKHVGVFFGVEPTNKKISSTGMAIYEMENGRIKRTLGETDFLGILSQIK